MDRNLSKVREIVAKGPWRAAVQGVTESDWTEQLNNNNKFIILSGVFTEV